MDSKLIADALKDSEWRQRGRQIFRTFHFESFIDAISFINSVADISEEMRHFPDIELEDNRVKISCTTRDEGGVTDKDVTLSIKIDALEN